MFLKNLSISEIQEWYGKERPEWKTYTCPVWEGQDLDNKSLVIMADGGVGDAILFSRYFTLIKEKWPTCKLHYLRNDKASGLFKEYPFEEVEQPDYKTSQLALSTLYDEIPPDPGLILKHIKSLTTKTPSKTRKIGLCWKCSVLSPRDIPLKTLLQLSSPYITFYSLLYPTAKIQIETHNARNQIIAPIKETDDWVESAKLILNMDLVISVDTGVTHLAGALQVPTFLLLPENCFWFWFKGSDCVWYPSVKIFRQAKQGDWSNVIQEVKDELV